MLRRMCELLTNDSDERHGWLHEALVTTTAFLYVVVVLHYVWRLTIPIPT